MYLVNILYTDVYHGNMYTLITYYAYTLNENEKNENENLDNIHIYLDNATIQKHRNSG